MQVVMDMDTSEPCGTNSDCCADQACLPFGLGGPQSAPVCGFAQCVLNATAATFNQTCVTANTLARGSPLARQVRAYPSPRVAVYWFTGWWCLGLRSGAGCEVLLSQLIGQLARYVVLSSLSNVRV